MAKKDKKKRKKHEHENGEHREVVAPEAGATLKFGRKEYDAELAKPHGIVVNRAGRRFANESAYYCLGEGWLELGMHAAGRKARNDDGTRHVSLTTQDGKQRLPLNRITPAQRAHR